MPIMNGHEMAKRQRELEAGAREGGGDGDVRGVPTIKTGGRQHLVAVTANSAESEAAVSTEAGFDAFFSKPMSVGVVRRIVLDRWEQVSTSSGK